MKKSNKILSLLLALAMVFTTLVPAFAATPDGEGQGPAPASNTTFKVKVTRNGVPVKAEGALNFVLYKKDGKEFKMVNDAVSTEYNEPLNLVTLKNLEKETSYKLVIGSLESTVVATTDGVKVNGFEFMTDKNGSVKTLDGKDIDLNNKVYSMVLDLKAGKLAKFRVLSLDEEGKRKPNVEFSFVNLKNENGKYTVDENGHYLKGEEITGVVTAPRTLATDANANFELSENELASLVDKVTAVNGQKIVGIVVNNKLVSVVELTNIMTTKADKIPTIVLRKPAMASLLKVYVKGVENKTDLNDVKAPKALKDAEVKILQNETKYQGEVKFGKVLATAKTNEDGYAEIKNPQAISEIIEILESDSSAKGGYYTEIVLHNKVIVSANGYMSREYNFKNLDAENGVYTIDVTLYPEGYKFTNRISGPKRYDTSVEVARKTYDDLSKVQNIVIASGDNFADGLAAASLSNYLKAPIVLNGRGGVEKSVEQFIKDVNKANNAKVNVVLVGGGTYLSGALTREIEALGNKVSRISGSNRYETSAAVYHHIEKYYPGYVAGNPNFYEPFIASGENFADALVASVPSALQGRPILLVAKDGVHKSVQDILARNKIQKAIVVGGTDSVSDKALSQISVVTERLSGNNRQLTSMKLAGKFFMNAGQAIIVDGTDFADALVAAQYGAKVNAPVLLTASKTVLGKDLAQYLRDNHMTQITIVGGTGSVSEGIEKEISKVLGGAEIK